MNLNSVQNSFRIPDELTIYKVRNIPNASEVGLANMAVELLSAHQENIRAASNFATIFVS